MDELPTVPPDALMATESAKVIACGLTDRGLVRKANEDAFLIAELSRSLEVQQSSLPESELHWLAGGSAGRLLVVADGMGGQGGGDVASRVAIRAIADYVSSVMPWAARHAQSLEQSPRASLPGVRQQLSTALATSNLEVREAAVLPGGTPNMGTTLTMAYLLWPRMYVAHVGDSRCYILRNGLLARLTTDHTVAEQMRAQGFAPLEASSPLHHILWNALGTSEDELVPEVHKMPLELGDTILLCTDGLNKHVDDEEITGVLRDTADASAACERFVQMTLDRGATDNVTVLVARVVKGD